MASVAEPEAKADLDAFREEVRAFLAENFPPELRGKNNILDTAEDIVLSARTARQEQYPQQCRGSG
jgi:hypothetical protein